jgi:hypothetical protein
LLCICAAESGLQFRETLFDIGQTNVKGGLQRRESLFDISQAEIQRMPVGPQVVVIRTNFLNVAVDANDFIIDGRVTPCSMLIDHGLGVNMGSICCIGLVDPLHALKLGFAVDHAHQHALQFDTL